MHGIGFTCNFGKKPSILKCLSSRYKNINISFAKLAIKECETGSGLNGHDVNSILCTSYMDAPNSMCLQVYTHTWHPSSAYLASMVLAGPTMKILFMLIFRR